MRIQNFSNRINSDNTESFDKKKQLTHQQLKELSSKAQEIVCAFFLKNVRKESPDWLLQQFADLFIYQDGVEHLQTYQALYAIIKLNQEKIFRNTLKRCCYILINNWSAARHYQHIQDLVELFSKVSESQDSLSPTKKRLKEWLINFFSSQDYQELKLFISRYNNREKERWSNRYASYLLASHSLDSSKPKEQREAAKVVANQLKEQFKLDLAMYTARSRLSFESFMRDINPTVLGDDVLHLIHKILTKRRTFSYASLANIFIKQTEGLLYKHVKKSLLKYLLFYLEDGESLNLLETYLSECIGSLYKQHDEQVCNHHLLLRTCNRIIECLTTQNQRNPTQIFSLLAIQEKYLVLAILLLKVILISKNSYIHLEACIGYLIQNYEAEPESDCQWFIMFLEILKLVLTIYAEDIRYNLVSLKSNSPTVATSKDSNSYRIFSQVKLDWEKELWKGLSSSQF